MLNKNLSHRDDFLYSRAAHSTRGADAHPSLKAFPHLIEISLTHRRRAMPGSLYRRPGIQITYVDRGLVRWNVDGRIVTLKRGDAILTCPWHIFGGEWETAVPGAMSWILIHPAKFSWKGDLRLGDWSFLHKVEEKEIGSRLSENGPFVIRGADFWKSHFAELRFEIDGDAWSRVKQTNRILSELVFLATRNISAPTEASPGEDRRLRSLETAILSDIDHPWRAEEIAGLLRSSTQELAVFLRRYTGHTFRGWLPKNTRSDSSDRAGPGLVAHRSRPRIFLPAAFFHCLSQSDRIYPGSLGGTKSREPQSPSIGCWPHPERPRVPFQRIADTKSHILRMVLRY